VIRRALLVVGLLCVTTASAQDADAPPMVQSLPPVGGSIDAASRDAAAQALAMSGREDRIAAEAKSTCALLDGDAIDAIVTRARDARIVIVNEAHESPRDRAFVEDLARALKPLGFTGYASETLTPDAVRTTPVYARAGDGDYTAEPAFGSLLRRLRTLGYTIHPITDAGARTGGRHFTDAINARETALASSLINQTLTGNPDARVLVHVGYGHNRETVERIDRHAVRWMALQVKEITGLDPLTIDQTTFGADRTGVCASEDGSDLSADRDLYVAHAPLSFERSRPAWRRARGEIFVAVPRALRHGDERTIVEARRAGEPRDATPVDRVLIDRREDAPLLLPPGRYIARAWTQADGWSADVAVTAGSPPPQAQKQKQKTQRRKKR